MSSEHHADRKAALEGVNRVVMQALSVVTPEIQLDPVSRKPLESYVSQLFDAVLSSDTRALSDTVAIMRRARITSACIAETYVPAVARRLGDAWVEDTSDFGAVSIGSARLQALLWRLEKDWALPEKSFVTGVRGFLVGVPEGAQHTLGATILAGQLRRHGMSVNLDLELTPERLEGHVTNQQLSGVLLSVAAADDLALLKELVDTSRYHSRNTPVIVGGSILERATHIKSQTGADLVTTDVNNVLWFCDQQRATRGDRIALSEGVA